MSAWGYENFSLSNDGSTSAGILPSASEAVGIKDRDTGSLGDTNLEGSRFGGIEMLELPHPLTG